MKSTMRLAAIAMCVAVFGVFLASSQSAHAGCLYKEEQFCTGGRDKCIARVNKMKTAQDNWKPTSKTGLGSRKPKHNYYRDHQACLGMHELCLKVAGCV